MTTSPGASVYVTSKKKEALSAVKTALAILKESLDGVPVPALKAVVGGCAAILERISTTCDNSEAVKEICTRITRLHNVVIEPLARALAGSPTQIPRPLLERIERLTLDLSLLEAETQGVISRGKLRRFLTSIDDASQLQSIALKIDRLIAAFTAQGVVELEIETDQTRTALKTGLNKLTDIVQAASSLAQTCSEKVQDGVLSAINSLANQVQAVSEKVQKIGDVVERLESGCLHKCFICHPHGGPCLVFPGLAFPHRVRLFSQATWGLPRILALRPCYWEEPPKIVMPDSGSRFVHHNICGHNPPIDPVRDSDPGVASGDGTFPKTRKTGETEVEHSFSLLDALTRISVG